MSCARLAIAAVMGLASVGAWADAVNTRNRDGAVGINLQRHYHFQPQLPFVNALKTAEGWRETPTSSPCNGTNQTYTGSVDANGYPREIGTRTCIHTRVMPADYNAARWPLGTWVLRYDGSAQFQVLGSGSNLSVANGRGTFQVSSSPGGLRLAITGLDAANPPRNMRLYPPGGVCAKQFSAPFDFEPWSYCSTPRCQGGTCTDADACSAEYPVCVDLETAAEQGGATFHPLWLRNLREYRTIRFMDWLHTNHSTVLNSADWLTESDWSWEYSNHPGNVPLSVIARLCNTLNTECYVNVPHAATDDTIRQMARTMRDLVAPHLPVYMEYSNEVWNGQFTQNTWAREAADALPDSQFDGTGCLSGTGSVECENSFTGMRTYQMCNIAQAEFDSAGQSSRLVCVLGRQASDSNKTARTLDCPRWLAAPNGNCMTGSQIDTLAVAPYFGDQDDCSEVSTVAELVSRMQSDVASRYCLGSGATCFMRRQFDVLSARGLQWPILAYEGGSHQSDSSRQVCVDAVTDPLTRNAYFSALDAWKDHADVAQLNIRQFIAFNSLSAYGIGGSLFGARGHWEGTSNQWPKEDGLLDWKNTAGNECWWPGCAIPAPSGTGPQPPIPPVLLAE